MWSVMSVNAAKRGQRLGGPLDLRHLVGEDLRRQPVAELLGDRARGGVGGVGDRLVVLVVVRQRGEQQQLGLVLDQDLLEAVDQVAAGERVELLDQVLVP